PGEVGGTVRESSQSELAAGAELLIRAGEGQEDEGLVSHGVILSGAKDRVGCRAILRWAQDDSSHDTSSPTLISPSSSTSAKTPPPQFSARAQRRPSRASSIR